MPHSVFRRKPAMTNMKKFLMLLTVAAIALMCFTGCSVNITSIGLPADMQLEKGETAQLEISYGADKENAKADAIALSLIHI